MTLAQQVNSAYLYYFAIRSSVAINPDVQHAPQPVYDPSKNPNGFVAGSPTQFVFFNAQNALSQPFQLFQFATQQEAPNPSDPTNPINLAVYPPSTLGRITNFTPVTPGTSANPNGTNILSFTLFANFIPDITAPAQNPSSQIPQMLQVQLLTMNTTGATAGRTIDYLGAGLGAPDFVTVDLRTSNMQSNLTVPGPTLGVPCNDPDLQITAWSISVAVP